MYAKKFQYHVEHKGKEEPFIRTAYATDFLHLISQMGFWNCDKNWRYWMDNDDVFLNKTAITKEVPKGNVVWIGDQQHNFCIA